MIYRILKIILLPLHRLYYKNIVVEGKENIPEGGVIFTSNHQNAMMDAMAINVASGRSPYFMARADIFENSLFSFFLKALRIIPIYRRKDGKDSMKKNDDVFDNAAQMIFKGKPLAMFPEAGHADHRRLQALRKGFVRIGFKAMEKTEFKKPVSIVPVGIYYSDYSKFRHSLHVRFGKPVALDGFKELYESNPQKAFNVVKSKVAKQIIPMMINIKNYEYYHTFERLLSFYAHHLLPDLGFDYGHEKNMFLAKQKVIYLMNHVLESKPDEFHELRLELDEYFNELQRLGYTNEEVEHFCEKKVTKVGRLLSLVLSFPLALAGYLTHIIPYMVTKKSVAMANDKHFNSTYKFGVGVVSIGLFYVLLLLAGGMAGLSSPALVIAGISLPLTGFFVYKWTHWWREWRVMQKLIKAEKKKEGDVYRMLKMRIDLLERIKTMVSPYF